jgi:hypothetical protein
MILLSRASWRKDADSFHFGNDTGTWTNGT